MTKIVKDEIVRDYNEDGIDRRGFLKCMAWAGTGALCVMQGGVLKSYSLSRLSDLGASAAAAGELSFVQISDSHMGFNKPANPDVAGTLKAAVDKINALSDAPEFLLHTGDISHLSKPEEFDTVDQILKATGKEVFFVPGEHDVLNDDGAQFRERYGKGAKGAGWYSFEKKGVHFNRDDIPHTVLSDDKAFKSKVLDTDEKFSFMFTKPGTYGYFCSVHPKMTGKVVVQ